MLSIGLVTLLIAVPLSSYHITPSLFNRLTVVTLVWSAVLAANSLYYEAIGSGIGLYSGFYQVTSLSVASDCLLFIIGAIVLCGWASSSTELINDPSSTSTPQVSEYSLLILFTLVGASMLVSSSDMISMFVSVELQSFAVYVLAAIYKRSETATAAALKYFFLGAFSSAIILLGTSLVYASTGMTDFQSIFALLTTADTQGGDDSVLTPLTVGFLLVGIGFLFKVAAAPFHNWAPDVYDGTPTIVTLWLSTMPKISIFTFLLAVAYGLGGNQEWQMLLVTASVASLLIGTLLGLSQHRVKRLLTYSTISHVGFLLLALCTTTEESMEAFLFYLAQYSLTNATILLTLLGLGYMSSSRSLAVTDIELIKDLKGHFSTSPLLALSMAICLFSMAGIPPMLGFFAKQRVLLAALHSGYYTIALIAILVSVVSAFYYLKLIKLLFFYDRPKGVVAPVVEYNDYDSPVTGLHSTLVAFSTLVLALYMVNPSLLLNSCRLLASVYYVQ